MQLSASRSLLALAALFGASMVSALDVSGFDAVWQAFAKPLVVRSGGLATATLEVVMTDTSLRRLVEERELATDPIYIELSAYFYNNIDMGSTMRLTNTHHNSTRHSHADKSKTKPGHSGKSTDDLQFRSAKITPALKPRVTPEVETVNEGADDEETVVTWTIPLEDIVEDKKYTVDVKVKVGSGVDSGELLFVNFFTEATQGDDSEPIGLEDFVTFIVK